ncbi:MAG: lysophospholipid acyltransferase family protein [Chromatiales bacterium]|jgi:KDO2-lipid IV(A) lauroyltransferase
MLSQLLIALWRRLGRLPLPWLHGIGRMLGLFFWLIPNRERRTTRINLALCFPELNASQREAMCRRTLQQLGCSLMELSAVWFCPMSRVSAFVRRVSGEENLQREAGQGLILLVPHLGCWEIIGLVLPACEQVTSLYRPPRKPQLETLIKQARERSDATLVATDNQGVRRIYQALRQGGTTCILPDQQPQTSRAAVFAPFFRQPALTMMLINRLARKTGAKIVIGYAERLPKGAGYHIHYRPAPAGLDDADPQQAAQALNQALESVIRECPDQYQWSYKRFRSQPDGLPSPYRDKR